MSLSIYAVGALQRYLPPCPSQDIVSMFDSALKVEGAFMINVRSRLRLVMRVPWSKRMIGAAEMSQLCRATSPATSVFAKLSA